MHPPKEEPAMASPLRPAFELLVQYALYHRDRRNIQTHLVGVPMIVFAIGVLLSHPAVTVGGWAVTPAGVLFAGSAAWYLTRGELGLQLLVTAVMALLIGGAHVLGQASPSWLAWGVGLFVVGWIIQFVGHWYEGRKPAFADDLVGLLVGPMFVVLELAAAAGLFRPLVQRIEAQAGPVHLRDLAHPAGQG
jgi:uncharacterized membrane protein YGL010W